MSGGFPPFYPAQKRRVEAALRACLKAGSGAPARLAEAMRYSTLGGGKRLRGVLVLEAARLGSEDRSSAAASAAAAVELIHAYSLVHDDLPAMDDDDYRRGKASCHRRFGEATAILCGNALYARGLAVLNDLSEKGLPGRAVGRILGDALGVSGAGGLIGGQQDDFSLQGEDVDEERVRDVYRRKTGSLMALSLRTGGRVGGLREAIVERLGSVGTMLGIAFQIRDDLLEREGDFERLGKDVGSDRASGKRTYPSVVGPERARRRLEEDQAACLDALSSLEGNTKRLAALVRLIGERDR